MVALPNTDPSVVVDSGFSIRAEVAEIKRALAVFARVADKRSTMPALANVLIRVTHREATLTATDLNVSVTLVAPAWGGSPGEIAVNAKALHDLVKGAPGYEVILSRSGALGLRVASDDFDTTLIGSHARDYPKVPEPHYETSFAKVNAGKLRDLIDSALPSACKDEARFHLNGVLLESGGGTIRTVATDGHRLTRATAGIADAPRIPGAIVPSKGASEIAKLLTDGECEIAVDKLVLFVRQNGWTVAVKLVDAQFPPYEQVIPKAHDKIATVEPLIAALRRAHKLNPGKGKNARGVKLSLASGKLTLTSDNPDTGSSSESLRAASQWLDEGGTTAIGVNPSYLLDAIDSIGDKYVTLEMGGELDPVLIRGTDDATSNTIDGSPYLVVVMPMRI